MTVPKIYDDEYGELSEHEKEILQLLSRGFTPKQIAKKMNYSYEWVKARLYTSRIKLGAVTTYETIATALREKHIL